MAEFTAEKCEEVANKVINEEIQKVIDSWLLAGKTTNGFGIISEPNFKVPPDILIKRIRDLGFEPVVGSHSITSLLPRLCIKPDCDPEHPMVQKFRNKVRGMAWVDPKSPLAEEYHSRSVERQWEKLMTDINSASSKGSFEFQVCGFIASINLDKLRERGFNVITKSKEVELPAPGLTEMRNKHTIHWGPQTRPAKKLKLTEDAPVKDDKQGV